MVTKMALGADLCNVARGFMLSIGCIQSRQCNTNTCPTGVATQDKRLQRGLVVSQKYQRACHFHDTTVQSCLEIIGAMGFDNPGDVNRHAIMRRVSANQVLCYSDIFPALASKALLNSAVERPWADAWQHARAGSF